MIKQVLAPAIVFCIITTAFAQQKRIDSVQWQQQVLVNDEPVFNDPGGVPEAGGTKPRRHGIYGSQYCRLLKLNDGSWLAGYTVSRNNGYHNDPNGGLELQFSQSKDDCHTWQEMSILSDPGRDLDNAQMFQLPDGSILLACRSVRWQESYMLPVYKSTNHGKTWEKLGIIDETHGKPGELGKPDKGIYEPHFYLLDDGRLAVIYANEKHVVENPSYSQIISEKISPDLGKSWGREIWVAHTPGQSASRPGMPVWTKMKNGRFIVVYEVCGPEACNIYCKTSSDGINWPVGLGSRIHDQLGGPYVLSLNSGNLIVTSNSSQVSVSNDFGDTWKTINMAWQKTLWPSLYEIRENEIGAVNSVKREQGGNNIQFAWAIYNSNVLVPSLTPMEIYWRTARVPAAGKISPDKTALNLTIYLCLRASGSWVKNTKKPECSSPVPFIMHANARTGQVRYLASETGAGASRDRQAVHRWLHPVF